MCLPQSRSLIASHLCEAAIHETFRSRDVARVVGREKTPRPSRSHRACQICPAEHWLEMNFMRSSAPSMECHGGVSV